jgi:hypothetical protein
MGTRRVGKAKSRERKRGRTTSGRRGGDLGVFDGLCREMVATQGRDVLCSGDPLQAEMWASHLVGLWHADVLIGEPDAAAAIGGRMVSIARRTRTPEAVMLLRALAAVADGGLRQRASAAVGELGDAGARVPGWVGAIGTAQPTTAWRATDLCGDQDAVMIGFAYPGCAEHSLTVLVDHPLGGIAKDAALLGPLHEVVGCWQATSDIELVEESIAVAAGRVIEAMDWTGRTIAAPVTDDYVATAALLTSRLGPIATPIGDSGQLAPQEREELVKAFLADPAGADYAHDPGAWYLIDCAVDFRCDYGGGDPLRWSPAVTTMFLLDFVPRKLSAHRDNLARMPEVLRCWVPWAARRASLPAHLVSETLASIDELEGEFGEALDDECRWGPAKQLAMRMLAANVDPSDLDSANAWLAAQRSA